MKAVAYYEQGGPEKLVYKDRRDPKAREGEALIKVETCALNRLDILTRSGIIKTTELLVHMFYPNVTCCRCVYYLSGEENICNSPRLIRLHTDGGYAEYVNAPVKSLDRLPQKFPQRRCSHTYRLHNRLARFTREANLEQAKAS